jgi:hypothetical protein
MLRSVVLSGFLVVLCHAAVNDTLVLTSDEEPSVAEALVKIEALVGRLEGHEELLAEILDLLHNIAEDVEEIKELGEAEVEVWPGRA